MNRAGAVAASMAIAMQLPGLEVFLPEVPAGRVLVVEGGMDPAKGFFAAHVGRQLAEAGRDVRFVTSRDALEIEDRAAGHDVHEAVDWDGLAPHLECDASIVVDSFSFLALNASNSSFTAALRGLRRRLQTSGDVAVLVVEHGMLAPRAMAVLGHLADGVVQFHAREDADGAIHYLRIPKWLDDGAQARNIYYSFDGRRLMIDTRNRVN